MRLEVAVTPPYPVFIEKGSLERLASYVAETAVALISDEHVAALYAGRVQAGLEHSGKWVKLYVVATGEKSKSLDSFGSVLRQMVGDGFDRQGAVLALGGGIVGDLAGFVAASYMRGIAFYQCPTSLLAMVDASVGGKTGINLPEGKNLVGAFWQPRAVIIDPKTLDTLPPQEFRQGAVELYKHGLLADPEILARMEKRDFLKSAAAEVMTELISRSVAVKAKIVAADEREQGQRAFLNLGHSLAHALESYTEHTLSHGDAVAYGLLFAAKLAAQRGFADETKRLLRFLDWLQPAPLNLRSFELLKPYLSRDKKNQAGTQRWVLLESIGRPRLLSDIADDELKNAWQYLLEVTK